MTKRLTRPVTLNSIPIRHRRGQRTPRSYSSRPLTLVALLLVALVSRPALSADITNSSAITYPPYPDVWHRFIPQPRVEAGSLDFFRVPDGDYFLVYPNRLADIQGRKQLSFGGLLFFRGTVAKAVDKYGLLGKYGRVKSQVSIKSPNGGQISLRSLDPRPVKRCPQDLYHYYRIEYPDGRAAEQKALLYVLDKPRQQEIQPLCADTLERSFTEKVVSVQGLLVPLDDGTFLLSDRHLGVVLRFDPSFHTKSDLLNRKLFVVDPKLIQHYMTEGSTSYQGMQDGVLGIVKQRSEGK